MSTWTWVGFVLCSGLGWLGALAGFRVGLFGARGAFLFRPLGALIFMGAGGASFALFLLAEQKPGEPAYVLIPMVIVIPFVLLPYGAYLACLALQIGAGFFSLKTSQGDLRTYDQGDAAMARQEYTQAAACYRKDLARWPGDSDAVLRLARALEAAGEAGLAAMELVSARLDLLDPTYKPEDGLHRLSTGRPGGGRLDRNERLLQLTYALGDLYAGPLGAPRRAVMLYAETLERLYGFKGVDPLRERLKRLQGALPRDESEDQPETAPQKLTLD